LFLGGRSVGVEVDDALSLSVLVGLLLSLLVRELLGGKLNRLIFFE